MIANYHTHTWRCHHATGTEREYVEQAIGLGLKILGFSDHTPYIFDGDYYSTFRMTMNQVEDYAATVLDLKREYSRDIEIHLGLEAEYYPRQFPKLLRALEGIPFEYFLLGQHFTGGEPEGVYSGSATKDPEILRTYCRETTEALETGRFTYFAHPDLLNFIGDEALYEQEVRKLCRRANQLGIPLELNFLGLHQGRHYPNRRFWRIAGEEGCRVVYGFDAHAVTEFDRPLVLREAERWTKDFGLKVLETVPLRDPLK